MSVWRVRESRELGKEGRVWSLGEKGLTVGRSSACDIQLLSQSVESKHAVFEWNQKEESYVIRDLDSVNGTYVNMLPLRDKITVLKHGDTIRFGYERGHLFRLEEVTVAPLPSPPPLQHPATSTATATQTADLPPHKASPSPSPMAVQYVPVSSQPPTFVIPAVQQALPYIMPQPMAYGYPAPLATPMHPQLMQPHQHLGMMFQPASPAPSQQPAPPTPVTHSELTVEDIELESKGTGQLEGSPSPRRDGRRPTSASNIPSLSHASPLYGQPAWWGEGVKGSTSDSELGYSRPGSVILRDLDFEGSRVSAVKSQRVCDAGAARSSTAEGMRKQAISNRASEHDMTTSWTVGFGSTSPRKKPPKFSSAHPHGPKSSPPRARSASPSRRSQQRGPAPQRRSLAGRTSGKQGAAASPSPRLATRKPPSGGKRAARRTTPTAGRAPARATPAAGEQVTATPPSQPATPADAAPKPGHNLTYTASSQPSSGSHASVSDLSQSLGSDQPPLASSPILPTPPPVLPTPPSLKCPSESQVGQKGDATYVIAEGERPGSARKQWQSDQSQPPTSLMLASIEARMRRLSRMAQSTLLSVKETLGLDERGEGLPPSPSPRSTRELPEWKFFNKEVDSVFRNIRIVERCLGEVGGVVATCRGRGGEEVDYEGDSESEGTGNEAAYFPDSVEDALWSSSGTSSLDPNDPA